MKKISIVLPLYNEESRLNKLFSGIKNFKKTKYGKLSEIIFVNDGSIDNTEEKISNFIKKNKSKYKLIKSKKNLGKGYALKLGVKRARYNWIFTMDSDLSVGFNEINKWIVNHELKKNYAYFASRNHKDSIVKKRYYRKLLGIIFQIIVFIFFDKSIKDSQCGFKLYNKKYAKNIFKKLKTFGFAHDLEIINLLKEKKIIIEELPVTWTHMDKGKLNVFTHPLKMLIEIILIKLR